MLKGGGWSGVYSWLVYGVYIRQEGYWVYSRVENILFNGWLCWQLGDCGQVELLLNYVNSFIVQDFGGFFVEALLEDCCQAWGCNFFYDVGEFVEQGRVGLILDYVLMEDW